MRPPPRFCPRCNAASAPVLILNLQPVPALDYPNTDTGEWLANCAACCVPEIANAFARSRIPFNVVTGLLNPADGSAGRYFDRAWAEIGEWVAAAAIVRELRAARIGFLGHTYAGMLDMYSDFTMHHGQLGIHVEVLEMDDLHARVAAVTEAEIEAEDRRDSPRVRDRPTRPRPDLAAGDRRGAALVGQGGVRPRPAGG